MKKVIIFLSFILFCIETTVYGEKSMLPYRGGVTWDITQGTSDDPDNRWDWETQSYLPEGEESNVTHLSTNSMAHAVDFAVPMGTPIVATREATVLNIYTACEDQYCATEDTVCINRKNGCNGGWGNLVRLTFEDGRISRSTHLTSVAVTVGQSVKQGQLIGYSGNTGNSEGPHLHYQEEDENGQSQILSFADCEETGRIPFRTVPIEENPNGIRHYYTSMNTYNPYNDYRVGKFTPVGDDEGWRIEDFQFNYLTGVGYPFSRPFVVTYHYYGGDNVLNALGYPDGYVYQPNYVQMPGYDVDKNVPLPWIQDINSPTSSISNPWLTFVLNPYVINPRLGQDEQVIYGVVFPIHGQIRDYWRLHFSDYGFPACNEYYETVNNKTYVVQWFMTDFNTYHKITYDTVDGSFNDSAASGIERGDHTNISLWENIGCPEGSCGIGGVVPASAKFTITETTGYAPFSPDIKNWSTGYNLSYSWDTGDGPEDPDEHFNYTYNNPGTYTISLTVTDEYGSTDTASVTITVLAPVGECASILSSKVKACEAPVLLAGAGEYLSLYQNVDDSFYGTYYDPDTMKHYRQDFDKFGKKIGISYEITNYAQMLGRKDVACFPNGNIIRVWYVYGIDGDKYGVLAEILTPEGVVVKSQFIVNDYTDSWQYQPAVAVLNDGTAIIVWSSWRDEGYNKGIYGIAIDSSGNKLCSEFKINTYNPGDQFMPAIVALPDGGFVVAWISANQDGSSNGIFTQFYNADRTQRGVESQVNECQYNSQFHPHLAVLTNGNVAFVFSSTVDPESDDMEIHYRVFDSNGTYVSQEYRINQDMVGNQSFPHIISLSNGNFAVSFRSGASTFIVQRAGDGLLDATLTSGWSGRLTILEQN